MMRRIGMLLATVFLVLFCAPPAAAIEPPTIDPSALPPDQTGPDEPIRQQRACSSPTAFPGAVFADKPWPNDYLRLADAQKFATGAGVTVAVIDTGVNGSARVPALPGGDFVDAAGNGMSDCDRSGVPARFGVFKIDEHDFEVLRAAMTAYAASVTLRWSDAQHRGGARRSRLRCFTIHRCAASERVGVARRPPARSPPAPLRPGRP